MVNGAVADLHSRQVREYWSQIDRHAFWWAPDVQPRYDGTVGGGTLVAPLLDDLQRCLDEFWFAAAPGPGSAPRVVAFRVTPAAPPGTLTVHASIESAVPGHVLHRRVP